MAAKTKGPDPALLPPPLDDTARTEHRLEGLAPDNLLAFLALLGLLRTLEAGAPDWSPRVRWDLATAAGATGPTRPVLVLPHPRPQADIVAAALAGAEGLAAGYDFDRQTDINFPAPTARAYLDAVWADSAGRPDLFSALFSDAAYDPKSAKVEATPYCFQFGQGHQHFLKFLRWNAQTPAPKARGSGRSKIQPTAQEALAEALFHPWRRMDSGADHSSFRWDPAEDVRYAFRMDNPSKAATKEGTVHGANRLAAFGIATLAVAPVQQGDRVRLTALGTVRRNRTLYFRWPLWTQPASLCTIRALLASPTVLGAGPSTQAGGKGREGKATDPERGAAQAQALRALSIAEIWEAQRISVGKFMNVTQAVPALVV